ncbi:MAG: nickel pincer cofactor biosynthesis protein LarB [Victivallis vadensis]|uniref:nickel pincer cofactor biosynthesis protein LarB n=1 Tax=uncultured Victivallis sp. TaxID=354118 RepID=UPI0025988714|nr:nickel pincer cofactor biosynthesis protein LarB [uncultured Victivallis sp.]
MDVLKLLNQVRSGEVEVAEAAGLLKKLPYEELGFAKLDHHRELRRGCGEVVFCPGKAPQHLVAIFRRFHEQGSRVMGTRASEEQAALVRDAIPSAAYDPLSRIIRVGEFPAGDGNIAVCTGGTADIPVAEEAAQSAEFFGSHVTRIYDVGVAGIHRLLSKLDAIRAANAVIAVAGMEGALAGVVAGLVDKPVIAVPTSVGYGASFQGLAPLLTMLNSCAEGVAVVNIDNGFGAASIAHQINHLAAAPGRE